jgi:hypothetical protein
MNSAIETDLLGHPISAASVVAKPRRRRKHGYASIPGSGPAGQTCRGCKFYTRVCGGSRFYPKCGKIPYAWTNGPGTDIKASAPACSYWEIKAAAKPAAKR